MTSIERDAHDDEDEGVQRWGGCACGEVRYVYQGRPVLSLKCYCLDCQAWSGAGHIAAMWGWRDAFQLTAGAPHYHATRGDSGKGVGRGSCKSCGSALLLDIGLIPNVVGMIATSLDEPERFTPSLRSGPAARAHGIGWTRRSSTSNGASLGT